MFTWMYFWSPKLHPGKHLSWAIERGWASWTLMAGDSACWHWSYFDQCQQALRCCTLNICWAKSGRFTFCGQKAFFCDSKPSSPAWVLDAAIFEVKRWNWELLNCTCGRCSNLIQSIQVKAHSRNMRAPQPQTKATSKWRFVSQHQSIFNHDAVEKRKKFLLKCLNFPLIPAANSQMPQENMKLETPALHTKAPTSTNFLNGKEQIGGKTDSKCTTSTHFVSQDRCLRDLCFCLFLFVSVFWMLFPKKRVHTSTKCILKHT